MVASQRLRFLDGWRGLAIAGVLIGHFGAGSPVARLGVELFFVLSGRLMAELLFVRRVPLGTFYYRRFTRVWPTLFVMVSTTAFVTHWGWLPIPRVGWPVAVACLIYVYNYFLIFVHPQASVGHLWSLCVEEHSYLFLGLVALVQRRSGGRVPVLPVLIIAAAAAAVNGWIGTVALGLPYTSVYWRSDVRIASVLTGAAIWLLVRNGRLRLPSGASPALLSAGVAVCVAPVPSFVINTLGTVLLAMAVCSLDVDRTGLARMLSSAPLVGLGTVSFSLYLAQQIFMLIAPFVPRLPLAAWAVPAVVMGWLLFRLVERPARRWLNRHPPQWAGGAPVAQLV